MLVNNEWVTELPASEVHFMNEGIYDHCLAIINWEGRNAGGKRQFRYINMWSVIPEFQTRVQEVWEKEIQGTQMYKLVGKLHRTKSILQRLNKERFSYVEKRAETTMAKLTECQGKIQKDPKNVELIKEEGRWMKESIIWKAAKEQFLRQKSKIQWIRQGDQNTKYFHEVIKARKNTNRIFSIKDAKGNMITDVEGITDAVIKFYKELLGESKGDRQNVRSNLVRKGHVVQQKQREQLEAPVTGKEIKAALWSIAGDKSVGPDGYGSQFYKDCWSVVKQDVIESVKEFFNTSKMLRIINKTTLTLIPKNNHAAEVGDYRPIACCNTVYKIISKVLCDRLRGVLPSIIVKNQSAFVEGRSIVQNILICQDLVKLYNRKKSTSSCLIKIYLKKAYDSVEWGFMEEMLHALNFPPKFIKWTMVCISTTQYSIAIMEDYMDVLRGEGV